MRRILRVIYYSLLALICFPALIYSAIYRELKKRKWNNRKNCLAFIRSRATSFPDMDPATFRVELVGGGKSNLSFRWSFEDRAGTRSSYFVKIFLPSGTVFAALNHWSSPFPDVRARHSHERFASDMMGRFLLAGHELPVAKPIVFDVLEKMMITEELHGIGVSELLKEAAKRNFFTSEDHLVLKRYGEHLGKIHAAGFSLIDTPSTNCMWLPIQEEVVFTDLEYFTYEEKRTWDLGFALCSLMVFLQGEMAGEAKKSFLEGYVQYGGVHLERFKEIKQQIEEFIPLYQITLNAEGLTSQEIFQKLLDIPA